ncbi:uncharacterized protein LOC126882223 isoform X3 [Diabrotica virgifera virgifera]|uniref:Uncharacterized protein n=2 Tax=Diabrotica virgifera virgifera TaxID=50390 RepID=A0ABM5JYH7_DIAVI|nr:uncharacterized protein LOC126882223 isoform X3 [Diabrotica virgifera virgifera]
MFKLEMELNQGCEDSTITKQNLLTSNKDEASLEKHVIKSEFEECKFESNNTEKSLSDAYCSNNIKIEEHKVLNCETSDPSENFAIQEVKTEIKKELEEHTLGVNSGCETQSNRTTTEKIDPNRDVKLEMGASTEIDDEKHCDSMKTSNLITKINKKRKSSNLHKAAEAYIKGQKQTAHILNKLIDSVAKIEADNKEKELQLKERELNVRLREAKKISRELDLRHRELRIRELELGL